MNTQQMNAAWNQMRRASVLAAYARMAAAAKQRSGSAAGDAVPETEEPKTEEPKTEEPPVETPPAEEPKTEETLEEEPPAPAEEPAEELPDGPSDGEPVK